MISRQTAWEKVCAWTTSPSLRNHMRAVEIVMRAAALTYGDGESDVEMWGLAGLLHDADYERWPEAHPDKIVAWLETQNQSSIAQAISAHYSGWGVPHETPLDRALLACDEPTGFVMACCLIRPDGIASLTPKSVKKRLKRKGFAAGVDRAEVQLGIKLLNVSMDEHIQFLIDALKPHAEALNISGNLSSKVRE